MTAVQTIRQDTAQEKRVELHLHTAVSDPLAFTSARGTVKRAEAWGHSAIAITDHASVAALQEARSATEHIKVICGMEAYCFGDEEYAYRHPAHLTLLAKNQQGLQALRQLADDAHMKHFCRFPLTPQRDVDLHRKDLLLGSACGSGQLYQAILAHTPWKKLKQIAGWYDFLEMQPLYCNAFLLRSDLPANQPTVGSLEELKEFNRTILALGKKLGKPVCATGDVHFLDPVDEPLRQARLKTYGYVNWDQPLPIYFKTTEEMLTEFSYLGEKNCYKVVIQDPNLVAGWCE